MEEEENIALAARFGESFRSFVGFVQHDRRLSPFNISLYTFVYREY